MRPSLALSIGAVFAVLGGLTLLLAPSQTLTAFGLSTPNEGLILAHDAGVLLVGVGIIDWMARDAVGGPLRGLLWGNIFIRGAEIVVNGWEVAAGMILLNAGRLIALAIALALVVMFALALRRA